MEDTYLYSNPQSFPTIPNPKKTYSHFMYKAIIFVLFVLIIHPLFSSQFSETTDKTGNWELIQIIFVGIAVSYGLFSRKNDESEENHKKLDKMNSYLSNFLQVSSFFHDEADNQSGLSENYSVEMWKSRYLKRDSLVVLEKENSVFENREKPLVLPVRSLKSEIFESDFSEKLDKSYEKVGNSRKPSSSSGSKHLSMDFTKSRNWELGEIGSMDFEPKVEENCFLQSSIRYDSKLDVSKTEMKNEINAIPQFPLPSLSLSSESKALDSIGNRSERSQMGAKLGKSVRTIRKCVSASDYFKNRGAVKEKGINLISEKIFDFRDYEKGKTGEIRERNGFGKLESGEGRDVDKKADEFIAKFKEQIRLQRT